MVAKSLGYETTLHYASMEWHPDEKTKELNTILAENLEAVKNNKFYPRQAEYKEKSLDFKKDVLLISIGGPAQTMVTGMIGLLLLYSRKKHMHEKGMLQLDWLAVFLALFWLREIFNLVSSVLRGTLQGSGKFFGGDEARINRMLHLPPGVIPIVCAILGSVVVYVVIFRIIPRQQRFLFIIAGLLGGLIGIALWFFLIGPVVLP
jgi:hypothetical protein